jgi:WD40 repeat protein
MLSLAKHFSRDLVGFFSYSRDDDEGFSDALSKFRSGIQTELGAQLGRKRENFRIWQDKFAIPHGAPWQKEITDAINQSVFFVPIITPRVVDSPHCAFEFRSFLAREAELGRDDLIFPVLYIPVPELDDGSWEQNPVLKIVKERQYLDWRAYRPRDLSDPEIRAKLIQFCGNIADALRQPWESPEERQQRLQNDLQRLTNQDLPHKSAEVTAADAAEAQQFAAAEPVNSVQAQRKKPTRQRAGRRPDDRRRAVMAVAPVASIEGEKVLSAEMVQSKLQSAEMKAPGLDAKQSLERGAEPAAMPQPVAGTVGAGHAIGNSSGAATEHKGASAPPAGPTTSKKSRSPRPAVLAAGALAAMLLIGVLAGVWAGVFRTPATNGGGAAAPPAGLPEGAPSANFNSGTTAVTANAPKPATSTSCRPASTGPNDFVGGEVQPALMLKLTVKPRELRTIAVSLDGARIASAGDDGVIRIWDAASLKWLGELRGHTGAVYSVAFSADGSLIASASWDGTVRVWDAHAYTPQQIFKATDGNGLVKQNGVAFAPGDSAQYIDSVGDDGSVWIWDLQNPSHVYKWRDPDSTVSPARSLDFAPSKSGALVTASFDGKLRFYTENRKIYAVPAATGKLLHAEYSPDGVLVASVGVDTTRKIVKLWNAANRTFYKAYSGHNDGANSVAWSHDGQRLAAGEGGTNPTVDLWDRQSDRLRTFAGHTEDVEAVAFHPNGKWLISSSEDGMMKIWDIAGGKELLSLAGYANGQYVAYAPNGCYTGSANAPNFVTYVSRDGGKDSHDNGKDSMFIPGDSTAALLSQ